jgi:hypothetical protein
MDTHLIALCRDYVELVDLMRDSSVSRAELHQFDQQRQIAHIHLLEYTGMDRSVDMYRYARTVIHAARGMNYQ